MSASNVTIKRSYIYGGNYCGSNLIYVHPGVTGVLIQDVELDGRGSSSNNNSGYAAVGGSGFTCLRCHAHNMGMGFAPWGSSPVTIQDSYVHDLFIDSVSHNQDIYINGTTAGVTIKHNNLENQDGQTANILIDASWNGPIAHVTEDSNLFNGGGYEVYGGAPNNVTYIVITNNHFGRKFFASGGYWGPQTAVACGGTGNVWSGNVWDDTGQALNAC